MCYVIFLASAAQIFVNFRRFLSGMYTIWVEIRNKRSNKSILLAELPLTARMAENMMSLNSILTGIDAVIHVVRKDAP